MGKVIYARLSPYHDADLIAAVAALPEHTLSGLIRQGLRMVLGHFGGVNGMVGPLPAGVPQLVKIEAGSRPVERGIDDILADLM